MSFKPEVQADNTGKWYDNALRFATMGEAEASAKDLAFRWSAVRKWRAVESDDPVSHVYDAEAARAEAVIIDQPTNAEEPS